MKTRTIVLSLILTVCFSQLHCIRNKIAGPERVEPPRLLKHDTYRPSNGDRPYDAYFYYQNRKQTKLEVFEDTILTACSFFQYDEAGRPYIRENYHYSTPPVYVLYTYEYPAGQNIYHVTTQVKRADGPLEDFEYSTVFLNSQNHREKTEMQSAGSTSVTRTEYVYDAYEHLIEVKIYFDNRLVEIQTVDEYDHGVSPNGVGNNPLKRTTRELRSDGSERVYYTEYTYKYDVTKQPSESRTKYYGDNLSEQWVEHKYEYYENNP